MNTANSNFAGVINIDVEKNPTMVHDASKVQFEPNVAAGDSRSDTGMIYSPSQRKLANTVVSAMPEGRTNRLLLCSFGIFICYFMYGIFQEKITKAKYVYHGQEDKFHYALSMVFFQCIMNGLVARLNMHVSQSGPDSTSKHLYILCSICYIGAMFASNSALQFVAYPTQVLGKSAKPIPVMIIGVLLAGKRYRLSKFLFVLMIVAGVALFLYKEPKPSSKAVDADHTIGFGEILLAISLSLDGMTGACQDRMRQLHKTRPHALMYNLNVWSIVWLIPGLLLSGEAWSFPAFVQRHPFVLFNILIFGLTSALGQIFIFVTITTFGPLMCSIVTTTRKFFTILASVILFGNVLSYRQWIGTIFVFAGLLLDNRYGKEDSPVKFAFDKESS